MSSSFSGDPWENRTPVTGVRGRCLDRLTNGPLSLPTKALSCLKKLWCAFGDSNPGPTD